jgi:hypothetical protein
MESADRLLRLIRISSSTLCMDTEYPCDQFEIGTCDDIRCKQSVAAEKKQKLNKEIATGDPLRTNTELKRIMESLLARFLVHADGKLPHSDWLQIFPKGSEIRWHAEKKLKRTSKRRPHVFRVRATIYDITVRVALLSPQASRKSRARRLKVMSECKPEFCTR